MPIFTGTTGDDNITGSPTDDTINALEGNDNVLAREGNDTIDAGDGHDFVGGQQGNDTILAGAGDDHVRGGTGDDTIDGGAGFDRISFAPTGSDTITSGVTVSLALQGVVQDTGQGMDLLTGFEHLTGTEFNDVLTGDGGDNSLWGGAGITTPGVTGNDTISGGGGNDLVTVGAGNHLLAGDAGTDTWSLWGNQADTLAGVTVSLALQGSAQNTGQGMMNASGFENLSGSVHDDSLIGDGNDNLIAGDTGDDTLIGGGGNDTLLGDGAVRMAQTFQGRSGPITTYNDITVIFPTLTAGDDTLDGGGGNDILNGGGGNDTASFASWTERVIASLNNSGNGIAVNTDFTEQDNLFSIENLSGSAFNDSLSGNNFANVLTGGDGHDLLFGRGGDDIMLGGNGDDFLRGSDGADVLDGGAGWDRVSSFVPTPTAGISFDLNIQGVAQDTGQGMDTLIGIEHASGTTLNDTLTGNGGDNWLWDGADGDPLTIGTGDDVLTGGGGNDLLETGGGADVLDGGLGIDTWSFLGGQTEIGAAGVTASLALQGAAQNTEQGMMTATGFENLSGSLYDDVLSGDDGDNIVLGDLGSDNLSGGNGNDTLYGDGRITVDHHLTGGSGPITLFGNVDDLDRDGDTVPDFVSGNDTLAGGRGDDVLYGGRGDDVLTGNQHADTFVIEASSGDDRITDFSNQDTILFDASSGVDSFSDLTLTASGTRDTLITWGTGDSLLVEGVRPHQLTAADFEFGAASAALALVWEANGPAASHDYFMG